MNDKILHFIAGFFIAVTISAIADYLGLKQPEAYGFVSAFLAGALKEFADVAISKDWKRWDMFDFLATCAGGFAGVVLFQII